MGLYTLSEKDKQNEHNNKLTAGADFSGPVKKRGCTDPLFLLLLLVAWAIMSWVGYKAISEGHVTVLTNGYDWTGKICTKANGGQYFMPLNRLSMGICVESCPTETDMTTYNCIGGLSYSAENVDDGLCLPQIKTKEVMDRCIVYDEAMLELFDMTSAYEGFNPSYITEFYSDVINARAYIFGFGLAVALLLGFAWCFVMRIPGLIFTAVWIICFAVFGFLILLGGLMYSFADEWKAEVPRTHTSNEIAGAKGLAIAFLVIAGLWFCMLLVLRRRINLAIGLVKEAARAVIAMPLIVLYPWLQSAGLIAFLVPWVFYSVYVASLGDMKPEEFKGYSGNTAAITVHRFDYASGGEGYAWYMLFVLLWTAQFIVALGQITLALAVSTWYFTRDKNSVGNSTLRYAIGTSMLYHSGTAAFGSLIIAIIEFVRAIVAYIQKKAAAAKNKVAQAVLCCMQCCLWCFEMCMKFINKNAYIETAIFGSSFCESAKKAFFLIARNILRIGAVSLVSEFVIIIGKVFIAVISSGLSYYVMEKVLKDKIESPIAPTILVFILAWFIGNMFSEIFSMAVSTLLHCFIADEEMFGPEERYAGPELVAYINENGAKKKTKDEKNLSPQKANELTAAHVSV